MRIQTYFKLASGLILVSILSSCQLFRKSQKGFSAENPILLDTIDLQYALETPLPFHSGAARLVDIHHLELDLSFGLEKEEVYQKQKRQRRKSLYSMNEWANRKATTSRHRTVAGGRAPWKGAVNKI